MCLKIWCDEERVKKLTISTSSTLLHLLLPSLNGSSCPPIDDRHAETTNPSCHDHDRDDAADGVMRLFAAMQGALHVVIDCGGLPRPAGSTTLLLGVREKKKKSTSKVALLSWVPALSRPTDWRRGRWRSKHHTETGTQVWGLGVQVWTGT